VQALSKLSLCSALALAALPAGAQQRVETVADFNGAMPTGVTVSRAGRIFVNYPHWGDQVPFTVAEIKNGKAYAHPNAKINRINKADPGACLYSVQSVVVDPKDRLWALDTGSVKLGPNVPRGPKMVCMDLKTNTVTRTIFFPRSVVPPATYLNDVRFDLRRGKAGVAYITDSGDKAPNGIIIVDLATGDSFRRLGGHPSVKADVSLTMMPEGKPMFERKHGLSPQKPKLGSDGIAISRDGRTLYYCPLISRKLYSVDIPTMLDRTKTEADVDRTVKDLGIKGASDGLETDAGGRLYATDYEHARVLVGPPGGPYKTLAQAPRLYWMDTMSVADDGYLYFTANELQRQAAYHNGEDLRVKPYRLYRVKVNAKPVSLK